MFIVKDLRSFIFSHKDNHPLPEGVHEIFEGGYLATEHCYNFINSRVEKILWTIQESWYNYAEFMLSGWYLHKNPCRDFIENQELVHQLMNTNFSLAILDPIFNICAWVRVTLI